MLIFEEDVLETYISIERERERRRKGENEQRRDKEICVPEASSDASVTIFCFGDVSLFLFFFFDPSRVTSVFVEQILFELHIEREISFIFLFFTFRAVF